MTADDLRIGAFRYATTDALFDGSVSVAGPGAARMSSGRTLPEVFRGFLDGAVDVSELGLTFLLRALDAGAPFVAIPVFPNRVFRHSCVFVHADSDITGPADLVDRTIGEFGIYGQDSGVWAKGVLADDHGFRPEVNRWVIGELERPGPPFDFTSHPTPGGLEVRRTPPDRSLTAMLVEGEIDVLFTANVPQAVLDGTDAVRRLFPDYKAQERAWFARTGIFPIMHTVVLRRELLERDPGLARRLYDAFLAAKDHAMEGLRRDRRIFQVTSLLPWTNALHEEDVALMGDDWWPYGVAANRLALETYLRYHHEQGLSARRWSVEELFARDLLDT